MVEEEELAEEEEPVTAVVDNSPELEDGRIPAEEEADAVARGGGGSMIIPCGGSYGDSHRRRILGRRWCLRFQLA